MTKKILCLLCLGLVACNPSKDQLKKIISENPEIILETIEKNPQKFIEAFQKAIKVAQEQEAQNRDDEEKKKLEQSYENPLVPKIRNDETIRGTKGAPIVLVEYSDFECPFCSRGFTTVQALLKKYEGKIQFIYKHLPLSFHPQAMIASQYYEAIRLQNEEKAFKFHDAIYADQDKLKNGEGFLKKIAKDVGADMAKLQKDINSESVMSRIKEDEEEAKNFGIQGTPGFVLNGVPIKGAYPIAHFEQIITELKNRGKLKL